MPVVSRVSGVDDLVQEGVSGLLFPPGDEAALATRLEKALGMTAERRRATGEAAREAIRVRLSLDRIVERHLSLYRSLIESGEIKSLTQRTLEGAAWISGASVARLALRVVSVAILARLLTPHEYRKVAGALIAMDFAAMIYGMGLAPTLVQRKVIQARPRGHGLFLRTLHGVRGGGGNVVRSPCGRRPPADPGAHGDPEGNCLADAARRVQRAVRGVARSQHAGQERGDAAAGLRGFACCG